MSQLSKIFCVLVVTIVVFVGSIGASNKDGFSDVQDMAKKIKAINRECKKRNKELNIILNEAANSGYAYVSSALQPSVKNCSTNINLHNGNSSWWQYGGRIFCAILSSQLNQKKDFQNAFIDSAGVVFDDYQIGKKIDADLVLATGLSFGTNYVVRKVAKQLNNNGISVENLACACDVLPEGIARTVVNVVVRSAAEIATQPQVITAIIMAYIIKPLYCESD